MWRRQLGSWRNILRHQSRGLAEGSRKLAELGSVPETAVTGEDSTLSATLRELADETDRMTRRIEATLHALSSQMAQNTTRNAPLLGDRMTDKDSSQLSLLTSLSAVDFEDSDFPLRSWPGIKGSLASSLGNVPGGVDKNDGKSSESSATLSVGGSAHRALEA